MENKRKLYYLCKWQLFAQRQGMAHKHYCLYATFAKKQKKRIMSKGSSTTRSGSAASTRSMAVAQPSAPVAREAMGGGQVNPSKWGTSKLPKAWSYDPKKDVLRTDIEYTPSVPLTILNRRSPGFQLSQYKKDGKTYVSINKASTKRLSTMKAFAVKAKQVAGYEKRMNSALAKERETGKWDIANSADEWRKLRDSLTIYSLRH